MKRFLRFNGVGALGIGVQLSTVAALTAWAHMNVGAATGLGVAAAIVHNFTWHREWTWADRRTDGRHALLTFCSFALSNGAVSLVGNVAIVSVLVWWTGLGGVAANVGDCRVWGRQLLAQRPSCLQPLGLASRPLGLPLNRQLTCIGDRESRFRWPDRAAMAPPTA